MYLASQQVSNVLLGVPDINVMFFVVFRWKVDNGIGSTGKE